MDETSPVYYKRPGLFLRKNDSILPANLSTLKKIDRGGETQSFSRDISPLRTKSSFLKAVNISKNC